MENTLRYNENLRVPLDSYGTSMSKTLKNCHSTEDRESRRCRRPYLTKAIKQDSTIGPPDARCPLFSFAHCPHSWDPYVCRVSASGVPNKTIRLVFRVTRDKNGALRASKIWAGSILPYPLRPGNESIAFWTWLGPLRVTLPRLSVLSLTSRILSLEAECNQLLRVCFLIENLSIYIVFKL